MDLDTGTRSAGTDPRSAILTGLIVVLGAIATARLGIEFQRLLFDHEFNGAIDLWLGRCIVRLWFQGYPVYRHFEPATYPPGSMAILWPLVGWLPLAPLRWAWAGASIGLGIVLMRMIIDGARLAGWRANAVLGLLVVGNYATAVTIGNGQTTLFVLTATMGAVLINAGGPPGLGRDAVIAALVVVALMKPHVSAPFLWIVLFSRGGLRPLLVAGAAYAGLTWFATTFQPDPLGTLAADWRGTTTSAAVWSGHFNLHLLLGWLGLGKWLLAGTALMGLAHGVWAFRRRTAPIWSGMAVAAIVARLWTYHGVYDDILLLIPVVALLRDGRRDSVVVATLCGLAIVLPASPLRSNSDAAFAYTVIQGFVWIAALVQLVRACRRDERSATFGSTCSTPLPSDGSAIS